MCCGATLGIHPLSKDFITFILGILRLQFISFSGWFVYDCSDLYDETNVYFRGLIILETLSYFFTIPKIAVKTLESHQLGGLTHDSYTTSKPLLSKSPLQKNS